MGNNIKYYNTFFGEGKTYYAKKMSEFLLGHIYSFNFFAFFKGPFWLLYRKLWIPAIITFAIYIIVPFFVVVFAVIFNFSYSVTVLINVILISLVAITMGFVGNSIYLKHAKRKVQYVIENYKDEDTRIKKLKSFGGTSMLMHILFILYVLFVLWLPYFF